MLAHDAMVKEARSLAPEYAPELFCPVLEIALGEPIPLRGDHSIRFTVMTVHKYTEGVDVVPVEAEANIQQTLETMSDELIIG